MTPARLRQLEAFRAVIRGGSVTRAADMLSISQPAVTKLVRALEDETGLVLFDRSRKRLVPTHEARRFEAEVDLLFMAAKRVDRMTNDMRNVYAGELRIAAMPSLGMHFLPTLLTQFSLRTGLPRVSITVASSLEVQDLVHAGQADLGFALPAAMTGVLVAAAELRFPAVLVLPPNHRLVSLETIPLEELNGERCVLLGRQFQLGDLVEDLFERHGVEPLYVAETQNASAACAMVASYMGVAVVDPITALSFGERICIRPVRATTDFPVQLLTPPGRPMSQLAARFVEVLATGLNHALTGAGLPKVEFSVFSSGASL